MQANTFRRRDEKHALITEFTLGNVGSRFVFHQIGQIPLYMRDNSGRKMHARHLNAYKREMKESFSFLEKKDLKAN